MKAKCKHCGDTVEVTRPREFKSCKCGAIALDYGDPPYYYRVIGNPEDFDGEIEDAPKIHNGDIVIEHFHPEQTEATIRYNDSMERAMGIIGEENIGGESMSMEKATKISESHEKKIIPIMWGNSTDQSTCGIVLVDNGHSKRLFFGSRENYTNEDNDAQYIADRGDEITKADLERLLNMIEGE